MQQQPGHRRALHQSEAQRIGRRALGGQGVFGDVQPQHRRLSLPPACAPQPLAQASHRLGWTDLSHGGDGADVDAEFQGRGADRRRWQQIFAQAQFDHFPVIAREIGVVGQELVGHTPPLGLQPQHIGKLFDGATAVGKNEILAAAQSGEEMVGDRPRHGAIGSVGRFTRLGGLGRCGFWGADIAAQLQAQVLPGAAVFHQQRRFLGLGAQEGLSQRHVVAKSRREADTYDPPPGRDLDPVQQALHLAAARIADEGVQLVDHHGIESAEQPRRLGPAPDQGRLQGFRGDQQDAGRGLARLALVGLGDIAVPAENRNVQRLAQPVEPAELIVDQGLERADIEQPEAAARLVGDARDQRQKRRLGLAAGSGGGNDDVAPAGQDRPDRRLLHRPEIAPALLPDPAPDTRMQAVVGEAVVRDGSWQARHRPHLPRVLRLRPRSRSPG